MKKEPLFELIKGLHQTEKSYFKKFASAYTKSKENNYLQLFDLIENQKSYNEQALKDKLKTPYFAQYKKHLFDKLMESLRGYHAKGSSQNEINILISNFEILYEKSLFHASKKALLKAKKIAEKTENLTEQIKIINLEMLLARNDNNIQQIEAQLQELESKTRNVMSTISEMVLLEQLNLEIIQWNKKIEWARSKKELQELESLIQKEIIQSTNSSGHGQSQVLRNYVLGVAHYFKSDFESSLKYFRNEQQIYREKNWLRSDDSNYIKNLANTTLLTLHLGQFDQAEIELMKFSKLKGLGLLHDQLRAYFDILLRLMFLCKKKDYKGAVQLIIKHSETISELEAIFSKKNVMYTESTLMTFYKVQAYLGNLQEKKALKEMNYFLNSAQKQLKIDLYCLARVVNLVIHFNLGNLDLLEYETTSTLNFLKKNNRLFPTEQKVIEYIQKSLTATSDSRRKVLKEELKKSLKATRKIQQERMVFEFFDFEEWINRS